MIRSLWFAIALCCAAALGYQAAQPDDGCTTDAECSLSCPPPNDDEDCDGGPQPVLVRI